jgi:hypothetical protein
MSIANATTATDEDCEIEVTPEMVNAGAAAIFEWRDVSTTWDLAELAYRAMERERRNLDSMARVETL